MFHIFIRNTYGIGMNFLKLFQKVLCLKTFSQGEQKIEGYIVVHA